MTFFAILIAALLESAASFVGGLFVIASERIARLVAHRILGFAIGALLGVTFFDLLPEAIHAIGAESALSWVLGGILLFFLLEKLLLWYHCHDGKCEIHAYTYLILIGDAVHNFIDGIILGLAFLVSIPLGIATTIAIVFHEIPQEIADFGILMAGGYGRLRALWLNFLISLTTIAGALLAYAFGSVLEGYLPYAIGLIAGNFLYLALSDLMPEIHESSGIRHLGGQLLLLGAGIGVTALLGH